MIRRLIVVSATIVLVSASAAIAQGIKRTPLQKIDFPDGYQTITAIIEAPPGGVSGPHTHPGVETGYLLEGEVRMIIAGKPPQDLKAGDSYLIPAGTVHDVQTIGNKPVKALSIFVVAKDKPLAESAK
jgi:quercetin dioxygenase-like cupin family protein